MIRTAWTGEKPCTNGPGDAPGVSSHPGRYLTDFRIEPR